MPFVEITKTNKYFLTILKNQMRISSGLLRYFEENNIRKIKLLYDRENNLFALKPSPQGYTVSYNTITCRKIPDDVPKGKFEGTVKDDMIIFDLSNPF